MKLYVVREWSMDRYAIYAKEYSSNGEAHIVTAEIKVGDKLEPYSLSTSVAPILSLGQDEAQMLLDALWQAGLRPANGEASSAHVEAMKQHIEDLRKIALNGHQSSPA